MEPLAEHNVSNNVPRTLARTDAHLKLTEKNTLNPQAKILHITQNRFNSVRWQSSLYLENDILLTYH